jgi:hypothetical protein
MSENSTIPSVYKRGADDGLRLGIFMIASFLSAAYSVHIPVLGLLAFALAIAVPFVVYHFIKRDYLKYPEMGFFSAMWMHGIAAFFFGSILLAAVMYVFLRFIEPNFVIDNLRSAISIYRSLNMAEATEMANSLQLLIDKHLVPSAISFAVTSIWSVVFSGSMLSLLIALLVRAFNKKQEKQV